MADREVVIHSADAPNAPSLFVSSVAGGVGSAGEIVVQLYRDIYRTPSRFRVTVRPDGMTQQAAEFDDPDSQAGVVRTRVGELILTPASAVQMVAWLQQAVAGLQQAQAPAQP